MVERVHPASVVILGVVEHSAQLVAESYQPAVFRAFFQRVQPDVICVEHLPQEFLRGDYYEHSYELQHIAVPFARQAGIPVYPIDWLPAADDQLLAWGVPDLETPPFIRTPGSYKQFLCFHDDALLRVDLFAAETEAARQPIRQWYDQPRQSGERDFPRRLGLYRTYMQAMRIKAVARTHPGATILIVIRQMHKEDVEGILGAAPELAIVQPSSFGYPSPEAVAAATTRVDLCAIASFNLLGVQSKGRGPARWRGVRGGQDQRVHLPRAAGPVPVAATAVAHPVDAQQVHLLGGIGHARRGAGVHRQSEGRLRMEIRRAYKDRLYPTRAQAEKLERVLDLCRELYNAALQERRDAYRMAGVTLSYFAQKRELPGVKEVRPEYRQVSSQVLQDVIQRVERAFAAFFRRVRTGERPGYPRFRGRDRYDSFTYSQAGWKLNAAGRLVLAGIGALKVCWSRAIQGTIKTVTIRRSADQWHVSFSCVLDVPQPVTPDRPATALDVGLEYFATLADGSHIANPRYLREAEEVLARRQRRLQTKRRGSTNRRRAKLLMAKAHRRIRNKRLDFHHQEARKIVDRHGAIAVEGLHVANMVRNPHLAKSIADAGWNQFLTILTTKAGEAGLVVVVVNPAGTSQVCSGCGRSVPKTLSDRWHTCPYEDCGLSLQRDHNSAREILNRAGLARTEGVALR